MENLSYPFVDMSLAEKFAYLKQIEKEVKAELKFLQECIKEDLQKQNETAIQIEGGTVQKITKVTVKPKETLQLYLSDLGILDICKKDEIDMMKIRELIDAGVLDEEETNAHFDFSESEYLKFKTN